MARDKKNLTPLQLWFEDAWEGWIRPLGLILLLAIGYLLYKFDILGERPAGVIAVLAIVIGSLATGLVPAWPMARQPWQRALLATTAVAALVACLYPPLRAALPGASLAEATLTKDKLSATLTTGRDGPYELTVSGHLKNVGNQDAEATYTIKAVDNGNDSDEISGAITRHTAVYRSRKGSSSAVQERSENTHRLGHMRGPQVTLTVDGIDEDQLDGGLTVGLRRGGLPPIVFIVIGALALLGALILDAKLVDLKGKLKAYVLPTLAIAFAFARYYPEEATPHALVRPAVSGFLFALVVGGLGGWVLSAFVKLAFAPKVKKQPARR